MVSGLEVSSPHADGCHEVTNVCLRKTEKGIPKMKGKKIPYSKQAAYKRQPREQRHHRYIHASREMRARNRDSRARDGPTHTWRQFWHKRAHTPQDDVCCSSEDCTGQGLTKTEGPFEQSLGQDEGTTPEKQTPPRPAECGEQQMQVAVLLKPTLQRTSVGFF